MRVWREVNETGDAVEYLSDGHVICFFAHVSTKGRRAAQECGEVAASSSSADRLEADGGGLCCCAHRQFACSLQLKTSLTSHTTCTCMYHRANRKS